MHITAKFSVIIINSDMVHDDMFDFYRKPSFSWLREPKGIDEVRKSIERL